MQEFLLQYQYWYVMSHCRSRVPYLGTCRLFQWQPARVRAALSPPPGPRSPEASPDLHSRARRLPGSPPPAKKKHNIDSGPNEASARRPWPQGWWCQRRGDFVAPWSATTCLRCPRVTTASTGRRRVRRCRSITSRKRRTGSRSSRARASNAGQTTRDGGTRRRATGRWATSLEPSSCLRPRRRRRPTTATTTLS